MGWESGREPGDPNAREHTSCSMHSKRLAAFPFGFLDDVTAGDFEIAIKVVDEGEVRYSKPMVGTPLRIGCSESGTTLECSLEASKRLT